MATRVKTIEFPFDSRTTSLAAATQHTFASITLYSPETTSRTFTSVVCRVTARSDSTTGQTIGNRTIGVALGTAAFSDTTRTVTIGDTAENLEHIYNEDFTTYFNTNFSTGTSQTCQVRLTFTGSPTINITAKLIITYTYDDSVNTRIKTVKIPLESNTTALTTTLASVGTNQIPLLNTFLPEAVTAIRDTWFEFRAKEIGASATDFQFGYRLDAEAETNDGLHECSLGSDLGYEFIWRKTFTSSATHNLQCRTTVTNKMNPVAVVLCVTYEYNESSTTIVLNPLEIPVWAVGNMGANSYSVDVDIYIEEPTTITMVQSGVLATLSGSAISAQLSAGAQTARTYTLTTGGTITGGNSVIRRIDSGASGGASQTLARGKNTITIAVDGGGAHNDNTGLLFLNYTSGKATGGSQTHNKTIKSKAVGASGIIAAAASSGTIQSLASVIPETSYWINSVGIVLELIFPTVTTSTGNMSHVLRLWLNGASTVKGSDPTAVPSIDHLVPTSRVFTIQSFNPLRGVNDADMIFKRHPNDPYTRLDSNGTLSLTVATPTANAWVGGLFYHTYHAITRTVAGTISGYTGGGSGIVVDAWRDDIGEKVLTATTTAGGAYTGTWYDDTITLKTETQQDATHTGRSAAGVAV